MPTLAAGVTQKKESSAGPLCDLLTIIRRVLSAHVPGWFS